MKPAVDRESPVDRVVGLAASVVVILVLTAVLYLVVKLP